MKASWVLLAAGVLLAVTATAPAANLARIDRSLKKEPAYKTQPKYCLLVFGPEARTRVWLVQDGATLYVDRHGDGDLTAPDDKVAAAKDNSNAEGDYTFQAGDVRDGTRLHKNLTVLVSKVDYLAAQDEAVKAFLGQHPKARGYYILVAMEMPGWKGSGIGGRVQQRVFYLDANGVFQFADRPQDAPVVWFGGPWQVALFGSHRLTVGRETDVVLGVGTPGVGPGTMAWIDYEGVIPANVYPTLEITYPPKHPGEAPVREHYELKRRC